MAGGKKSGCGCFLTVVLVILLVIIIVALVLFFMVRDTTTVMSEQAIKDTRSSETIVKSLMGGAIEKSNTTKQIDATFSEEDLNAILAGVVRNKPIQGLEGLAIKFTSENALTFNAQFHYSIFKTVLKADVEFAEVKSEEKTYLQFTIKSIKAGKIGLADWIIKTVGGWMKLEESIKNLKIGGVALNLKLEYSPLRVSIQKSDLTNLLLSKIADESSPLVAELLSWTVSDDNLGKLSFGSGGVGLKINLEDLAYSSSRDGEVTTFTNIPEVTGKLNTLLNNKVIDESKLDASANFIVKGYARLSDSEKSIVNTVDYSSVGISNKESYDGYLPTTNNSFAQFAMQGITSEMLDPNNLLHDGQIALKVNEAQIESLVLTKNFIGTTIAFFAIGEDNKYTTSIIVVDGFDMNITDGRTTISIIISINGYKTIVKVNATGNDQEGTKVQLVVDNIYAGAKQASESLTKALLNALSEQVEDDGWLSCDSENKTITFSFDGVVKGNNYLQIILNNSVTKTKTALKDNIDGNGYVQLTISWDGIVG